jgi:hypothetical protein
LIPQQYDCEEPFDPLLELTVGVVLPLHAPTAAAPKAARKPKNCLMRAEV